MVDNFKLIHSFKANDIIPLSYYKSSSSGLKVVIAEVEGPIVTGSFCVATESHDDDGLPHALEHLVFMGSEDYPYNGVLNLLASRCISSGTNAWTGVDQTSYHMETAGSEGFLKLLPIFAEHILYPTLTDSAFVTEVHHITGEGKDAGVIYCEMQSRKSSPWCKLYLELRRGAYPGDCGYRSNTGGALKNLRESTTNDKVRKYHREFYRPENLTLFVAGQVNAKDVFEALAPIEEKILSKGNHGPFVRPWQSPIPPLAESMVYEVPYGSDDEANGFVLMGWRGPVVNEIYRVTACSVLMKYLTETSVSPLQKQCVEIPDPYANKVSSFICENSECLMIICFENVPKQKLGAVKDRAIQVLSAIDDGTDKLDMKRLQAVIHRQVLRTLTYYESSCHLYSLAWDIFTDMLYGNTSEDFELRANDLVRLRQLKDEPEEFWLDLLKRYFVDKPCVTVLGIPSIEEKQRLSDEEKKRNEIQCQTLGPNGLKAAGDRLAEAIAKNKIPPPPEMIKSIPIPSIASVKFHPIQSYATDSVEQHPMFDLAHVPVHMFLDDIHTNFVCVSVFMNTAHIPQEQRMYLQLLVESLLEAPVLRDGGLVSHEIIVAEHEEDTINLRATVGLTCSSRFYCGPYSHTIALSLQVEPAKYNRCITLIRELLYQTQFTAERLKIIATKIVNQVALEKQNGYCIASDLLTDLCFSKESNIYASSVLRQHKFLTSLLEKLDSEDGCQEVLDVMESIRNNITDPGNVAIHLAINVEKMGAEFGNLAKPWADVLPSNKTAVKKPLCVTPNWTLLLPPADVCKRNCIVGVGSEESSYVMQAVPSIKDYNDPDLAPLMVYMEYLTQAEGPLWKEIRGRGLAYGFYLDICPYQGLLYFYLTQATDSVAAYKETKVILENFVAGITKWDELLFESAKCTVLFNYITDQGSVADIIYNSVLSHFKGVDHDYNRKFIELVSQVTLQDLERIGAKYFAPLFDREVVRTTAVANPSKIEEIAAGFKDLGLELQVFQTIDETSLNEW